MGLRMIQLSAYCNKHEVLELITASDSVEYRKSGVEEATVTLACGETKRIVRPRERLVPANAGNA